MPCPFEQNLISLQNIEMKMQFLIISVKKKQELFLYIEQMQFSLLVETI